MRKFTVIAYVCWLFAFSVAANEVVSKYVPDAKLIGQGRLTYLIWDAYDAYLYAPKGQWAGDAPFALKLVYLVDISGKKIADRSVEEIRDLGFDDKARLAKWGEQMRAIFPNVEDGTELMGVYTAEKQTIFYLGSERIGVIEDPEFGKWFFGIWLSEDTSEPKLRRQLLGVK